MSSANVDSIQVTVDIQADVPHSRSYAVAFHTFYDLNEYTNVMDIQTFVLQNKDSSYMKWSIVELSTSANVLRRHPGGSTEVQMNGVLLQAFQDLSSPQLSIIDHANTYYVYIVTIQGPSAVNQTIKVTSYIT